MQWHPLFARLLEVRLKSYYEIRTDEPVSDLPREADLLVLRRLDAGPPPFVGLWSRLRRTNVMELKGPTDSAEAFDLELMMHVATGLHYRAREEARKENRPAEPTRECTMWFLAPTLGPTFLRTAADRFSFRGDESGYLQQDGVGPPGASNFV